MLFDYYIRSSIEFRTSFADEITFCAASQSISNQLYPHESVYEHQQEQLEYLAVAHWDPIFEREKSSPSAHCDLNFSLCRSSSRNQVSQKFRYHRESPPRTCETSIPADARAVAKHITALEREGHDRLCSFYVVFVIDRHYREHRYDDINEILASVEVSRLSEWSFVALLRSSFSLRNQLPAWFLLRDSAREKLESDGKDFRKLLRGML